MTRPGGDVLMFGNRLAAIDCVTPLRRCQPVSLDLEVDRRRGTSCSMLVGRILGRWTPRLLRVGIAMEDIIEIAPSARATWSA